MFARALPRNKRCATRHPRSPRRDKCNEPFHAGLLGEVDPAQKKEAPPFETTKGRAPSLAHANYNALKK